MRMDGIITLQWSGLLINFVYSAKIEKPRGIARAWIYWHECSSSIRAIFIFPEIFTTRWAGTSIEYPSYMYVALFLRTNYKYIILKILKLHFCSLALSWHCKLFYYNIYFTDTHDSINISCILNEFLFLLDNDSLQIYFW